MCNAKDYNKKGERRNIVSVSQAITIFVFPFCEILLPLSNISKAHFLSLAFYYVQHNLGNKKDSWPVTAAFSHGIKY